MNDFKSKVVEVKSAYDIADYIESSGVSLRNNGTSRMKGLCPFHSEKTPSFVVNEAFQSYRCFGCGASGDLISYVQETENLTFQEALVRLAEDKGIELEYEEEQGVSRRKLLAVVRESSEYFRNHFIELPEEHPAKVEITKRGLSLEKMEYGYAPEKRQGLYKHLKGKGFTDEEILITGLCRRWEENGRITDFWTGRLIFFVIDITNHPIGFTTRKLSENDKGGKYINSPDSPIYNKSQALYNLYKARKTSSENGVIYVVEGQFDVAAFVEAGMDNVVASSGTAFTETQAMMCRRLVRESGEIIFCFDGDSAGRSAARKVFENTPLIHSQSYAVSFPEGKDPDDLRQMIGNERFKKFVEVKKTPLVSLVLNDLLGDFDVTSELGREGYVEASLKVLRKIPSLSLRDSFLRRVAINSFTPLDILREMIGGISSESTPASKDPTPIESNDEVEESLLGLFDNDLYFLAYLIIALLVESPSLKQEADLSNIARLFPKQLRPTLKKLSEEETFVAEAYPYPLLMKRITEANLLPMLHLMDEDMRRGHLEFLVEELKEHLISKYEDKLHSKLGSNVEGGDLEVLSEAVRMSEKMQKEFEVMVRSK